MKRISVIGDLTPDALNANQGTARGAAVLLDSLTRHGAGRSILVDRNGVIIAGNKTHQQAQKLNLPIELIASDGSRLVVVQRTDLDISDPKTREMAILDNRLIHQPGKTGDE